MAARPTPERFAEIFNQVEPYVERRFGIPVVLTEVPPPFTGDLDGAEIHVEFEQDAESCLFLLAHLFGHTVQWNLSPRAREIGGKIQLHPPEPLMRELAAYEREACCYSLQLLHDAGVRDIDQWLSDFAACDFAYLEHFYRTGEKLAFRSFWRDGRPLLDPKPIPDFRPQRWVSRWGGIVV